jgi:hypothetical protein
LDSGNLGHEGQAARRWICVDWLIGAARDEERQVLARLHIAATAKLAAVPIAPRMPRVPAWRCVYLT